MPEADLPKQLERVAALAGELARAGERVTAVLPAEPQPGERAYLCTLEAEDGARTWVVLDAAGKPVDDRRRVRDTVTILALCELAEETAAGGDLDELRSQLAALRLTENPPGIDEADEAALELQRVLGTPPALATPSRLDAIGAATRELELALGGASRLSVRGGAEELERGRRTPSCATSRALT